MQKRKPFVFRIPVNLKKPRKIIFLFSLLFVALILPLTVLVSQQHTQIQQKAATTCPNGEQCTTAYSCSSGGYTVDPNNTCGSSATVCCILQATNPTTQPTSAAQIYWYMPANCGTTGAYCNTTPHGQSFTSQSLCDQQCSAVGVPPPAQGGPPPQGTIACGAQGLCYTGNCPNPNYPVPDMSLSSRICQNDYGTTGVCCDSANGNSNGNSGGQSNPCAGIQLNPQCGLTAGGTGLYCGNNNSCLAGGTQGRLYTCQCNGTNCTTVSYTDCVNADCRVAIGQNNPDFCGSGNGTSGTGAGPVAQIPRGNTCNFGGSTYGAAGGGVCDLPANCNGTSDTANSNEGCVSGLTCCKDTTPPGKNRVPSGKTACTTPPDNSGYGHCESVGNTSPQTCPDGSSGKLNSNPKECGPNNNQFFVGICCPNPKSQTGGQTGGQTGCIVNNYGIQLQQTPGYCTNNCDTNIHQKDDISGKLTCPSGNTCCSLASLPPATTNLSVNVPVAASVLAMCLQSILSCPSAIYGYVFLSNAFENVTGYNTNNIPASNILGAQLYGIPAHLTFNPKTGNFENNNIALSNIPNGNYQTIVHIDKYLDAQVLLADGGSVFAVAHGQVFHTQTVQMIPGDIGPAPHGDNFIDIIDYNNLLGCFGKPATGTCGMSDLNWDRKVDQDDLDLLMQNFGKLGFSFITPDFKCEADPSCHSGQNGLQLCSLKCTKKPEPLPFNKALQSAVLLAARR